MLHLTRILTAAALLSAAVGSFAQGQPQPLGPPPVPPANPQTPAKINLGKILFWEEQLSVTGTVACGTCHRPVGAGADPRTSLAGLSSTHPGPDGQFGNADDILASAGVPAHSLDGNYQPSPSFGLRPQVGRRKSPSAVNSAYVPLLFWDGRAGATFSDPLTGAVLIPQGGALENQALGPVLDTSEMAPAGAQIGDLSARISNARPLALSPGMPAALASWINQRSYPALFEEVFGSPAVTPARIAFAIASYERSLNSTQTPLDSELAGTPSLTQLERQGQQVFNGNDCGQCHGGPLLSDNNFRYIGVRPVNDDLGRFAITNNAPDRGAFRVPSLRNVELRAPFMHNGRFANLEEVVEFYNRGGDFTAPNKDPRVRPRNLTQQQKTALLAFLRRPLTDPRVGAELPPFDRPTLYSESNRVPSIVGAGNPGSGGVPLISALEPPLLGNSNFTVTLSQALGGAQATLVVSRTDPGVQATIPTADFVSRSTLVSGTGSNGGFASVQVNLPDDPSLLGQTLFGRFYIADPGASNGLAVTPAFQISVFGQSDTFMLNGFE